MIRTLKTLGLVAMACVMGALTASAASAQNGVLTSDGPVTLIATQIGEASQNRYTAFGSQSECGGLGTGHKFDVTPHALIPSGSSTGTGTPHAVDCIVFPPGGGSMPATTDTNGCDGAFHLEGTTGESDTYKIRSTAICPLGKLAQGTIFSSSSHALRLCTTTATPNPEGYTGLQVKDTTNGFLLVTGTIEGITVHRSGLCGAATETNGIVHVNVTLEGRNSLGEKTPISLSHSE